MADLSLANAIRVATEGLESERDEHMAQIQQSTFDATVALRMAGIAYSRGDLLEAAKRIREACDHELEALGDCEHCGAIEEAIRRAHAGDDGDRCETEGCAICAALNGGNLVAEVVS